MVFLLAEKKFNPFITKELNSLEYKATSIMIITIFGALFSSFNQQSFLDILIMIFLFGFNISFILLFSLRYLEIYLTFRSNSKIFKLLQRIFGKMRGNRIFNHFLFKFICFFLIEIKLLRKSVKDSEELIYSHVVSPSKLNLTAKRLVILNF